MRKSPYELSLEMQSLKTRTNLFISQMCRSYGKTIHGVKTATMRSTDPCLLYLANDNTNSSLTEAQYALQQKVLELTNRDQKTNEISFHLPLNQTLTKDIRSELDRCANAFVVYDLTTEVGTNVVRGGANRRSLSKRDNSNEPYGTQYSRSSIASTNAAIDGTRRTNDIVISALDKLMDSDSVDHQVCITFRDGTRWIIGPHRLCLFNPSYKWGVVLSSHCIDLENDIMDSVPLGVDDEDDETSQSVTEQSVKFHDAPSRGSIFGMGCGRNATDVKHKRREARLKSCYQELLETCAIHKESDLRTLLSELCGYSYTEDGSMIQSVVECIRQELQSSTSVHQVTNAFGTIPVLQATKIVPTITTDLEVETNAWVVEIALPSDFFVLPDMMARLANSVMQIVTCARLSNFSCALKTDLLVSHMDLVVADQISEPFLFTHSHAIAALMKVYRSTNEDKSVASLNWASSHRLRDLIGEWNTIQGEFPKLIEMLYETLSNAIVSGVSPDEGILWTNIEGKLPRQLVNSKLTIYARGAVHSDCSIGTFSPYLSTYMEGLGMPVLTQGATTRLLGLKCKHSQSGTMCVDCTVRQKNLLSDILPTSQLLRYFYDDQSEECYVQRQGASDKRALRYIAMREMCQENVFANLSIIHSTSYHPKSCILSLNGPDGLSKHRLDILLVGNTTDTYLKGYQPMLWEHYLSLTPTVRMLLSDMVVLLPCCPLTGWERVALHQPTTLIPPLRSAYWLTSVIEFYSSLSRVTTDVPITHVLEPSTTTKSLYFPMGSVKNVLPVDHNPLGTRMVMIHLRQGLSDRRALLDAMVIELIDRTRTISPHAHFDLVPSLHSQLVAQRLREASLTGVIVQIIDIDLETMDDCDPLLSSTYHLGERTPQLTSLKVAIEKMYRSGKPPNVSFFSLNAHYFQTCYGVGHLLPVNEDDN